MRKVGFALIACFLLVGCGPISQYNYKMEQLNNLQTTLEKDETMTGFQRELLYWFEVKKEFPEHAEGVAQLLDKARAIQAKIDNGQDAEQDINNYNEMRAAFWEGVRYYVRLKNDEYVDGLHYLGDTMSRTGQQINNDAQMRYEGLRNLQQNRPVRCTTSMGYLGTTAFTSCY